MKKCIDDLKVKLLSRDALDIWDYYMAGAASDGTWENSWYSDIISSADVSLASSPEEFGLWHGILLSNEILSACQAFYPSDVLDMRLDVSKMSNEFGAWTRDDLLAVLISQKLELTNTEREDVPYCFRNWHEHKSESPVLAIYGQNKRGWEKRLDNAMLELDMAFRTTYFPQIREDMELKTRHIIWFPAVIDGFDLSDVGKTQARDLVMQWRSASNQVQYASYGSHYNTYDFSEKLRAAREFLKFEEDFMKESK